MDNAPAGGQADEYRERIWFLSQFAEDPSLYHLGLETGIHGPVDITLLKRALETVVARYEVLRTVFALRDGNVVTGVLDEPPHLASEEDLRSLPAAARAAELARRTGQLLRTPFDLAAEPPIRFALLRLGRNHHLLFIVVHRIAADPHSARMLGEEIAAAYEGRMSPEPAGRSFGAFAEDVRTRIADGELSGTAEYWKRLLADLPDPLPLPAQRPRPELGTSRTRRLGFTIRHAVAAKLRELAAATETDGTTTVLAAFTILLHRELRTPDLVVGMPVDLRDTASPGAVGPFTEARPLRLRLPHDPTWREVIAVVRDSRAGVVAHRELPLRRLVEFANAERHPSMHPMFQILAANEPDGRGPSTRAGVTFDTHAVDVARSPYDLELRVGEQRHGVLECWLVFREELFAEEDMRALAERLLRLVRTMVADPDVHLSASALIDGDERERILYDWNRTSVEFPRNAIVHELFEQWADRTPDAPALYWEGATHTYAELDRRANQLARYLRRLGATKESRIGLHFGYAAEWVISALASLKVGAAYVPLDPAYPPERLAMMCEDAGVEILLTHAGVDADPGSARRVFVDDEPAIDAESEERLGVDVEPNQLAYVMFTSGSTGRPKGIAVTHRNIVRTVIGITYTRFAPGDSVAQGSNISFDATTLETWGALLNGARLVGLRKADLLEPQRLRRQLVEHEIDMMFLPAALMKQLVAEAPGTFASLRYFQSGGEQADHHTHQRIIGNGVPENLINPYGPTETTVNATAYRTNDLTDAERHVPIGYPLANTTCYVLDQYWQPVPAGVVGELFIGGDGVSRGYLGQSALTAEKFVPDPFGETSGARLYRTGDLARHRGDGVIEFLGRADRQVKIRGFRVEPAEVEAAVLASGQVKEVSVQVGVDAGGDQVLVAYLVPAGPEPDLARLRELMRAQVPPYMVPGAFVPLAALPLNANGKLDSRALKEFAPSASDGEPVVEPRTATEGRLDALMTGILQVAEMGVHDDFFSLGGDSFQAVAVVTRARTMFRTDIPLSAFFRNPTVASFAAELDRLRSAPVAAPPAPAPEVVVAPPEPVVVTPAPLPGRSTLAQLVEIWQEVLDVTDLGPDDDFFALGGHSLKVTRVASRVKATFGVNVPLRLLFANPTVKAFANAVDDLLTPGERRADPVAGLEDLLDELGPGATE